MLELGPTEQSIAKQAIRSGQELPERIANAPQLNTGSAFYLQAFFDLDAERSVGMGLGRIPWSVTLQYALYYGLDEDETEMFIQFIRAIDTAYLEHRNNEKG